MPNKTKVDVQTNTSDWILIFRTNNKKTVLMFKKYILCFSYPVQPYFIHVSSCFIFSNL